MRTNLTCEACQRELAALTDGELHPAVARALRSHVDACVSCQDVLAAYEAIAEHARRLPSIEAPAWLEDRIIRVVTRPARLRAFWSRVGAGAAAASFALGVGLLALGPRLAAQLKLPSAGDLITGGIGSVVDLLVAIPKRLASDLAFYEPVARQIMVAFRALAALPRAALVVLQTPEAQTAGAILLTLGVAIYLILRPSRSHERGIGHACLAL